MERLQKIIATSGYCSRRKAEEFISKGEVMVDGKIITEMGVKVSEKADILVEGNLLSKQGKEYILLYKPRGVVATTSDDKDRKTVMDLIHTNKRLYPVGRLDYDTTGILLLTNDGELTNLLLHPKNNIDKVYVAKIEGVMDGKSIHALEMGIKTDEFEAAPCKVKIMKQDKKTNSSLVQLTIHEGKNHQVKKMFSSLGYEVLKLKREKIAFLDLEGLKPGEYRTLTVKEVKKLYGME